MGDYHNKIWTTVIKINRAATWQVKTSKLLNTAIKTYTQIKLTETLHLVRKEVLKVTADNKNHRSTTT